MSMTFLDLQNKSLARVDETIADADAEVLSIIKDAINNGYLLLTSLVDKRTKTITMALEDYNNKLPIPLDFCELVLAEHEIIGEISPASYEKLEDIMHFTSRDLLSGDVTLTYVNIPPTLVNDTDILRLKDIYLGALTAYSAYVYQLYKKKYSAAQLLLQEFNSYIPTSSAQLAQQAAQQTILNQ